MNWRSSDFIFIYDDEVGRTRSGCVKQTPSFPIKIPTPPFVEKTTIIKTHPPTITATRTETCYPSPPINESPNLNIPKPDSRYLYEEHESDIQFDEPNALLRPQPPTPPKQSPTSYSSSSQNSFNNGVVKFSTTWQDEMKSQQNRPQLPNKGFIQSMLNTFKEENDPDGAVTWLQEYMYISNLKNKQQDK